MHRQNILDQSNYFATAPDGVVCSDCEAWELYSAFCADSAHGYYAIRSNLLCLIVAGLISPDHSGGILIQYIIIINLYFRLAVHTQHELRNM